MIHLIRINHTRCPARRTRETDLKVFLSPLLCLALALSGPAAGGEAEPGLAPLALEPVVVVSSRSPRPVSEVVGMVSVLDDRDIDTRMATDAEGLWRYTPGVQVESSGDRFSARSLSIRGIGGNRVLMEVDGIPVQERFSVGAFAFAGRSGAEPDFIRRVEVLRGPASSLYGSRAIGGVVAISTFDPGDLAEPGSPGGAVQGSHAGHWDGTGASALGAWQGERVGLLFGGSARRGHESDHSASPPNPDRIDRDRAALLAKATLAGGSDGRLRLTIDADRDEARSELNSVLGQGRFANTTRLAGDDRVTRTGVALDGQAQGGALKLEGAVFYRETRTRQDTLDLRETLARPVRIDREFSYDTTSRGARARASREFEGGGMRHRLLFGADYARTELEESRDALQTGLLDGQSTPVVLGERFPLRDFPVSVSQETGVYLQDEIDSLAGRWTLIPALRYDRTRLRVEDDEAWRRANPNAELAELEVSDLSPRLGALWRFSREVQAWAQVASGFRAPPAEDLNIGLDIPLFNIRALPNPDLDSESSLGWELGLRAGARGAWLSAAAFWTDYEDFIVSMVPLGPDPETGTLLFQSQNVARVRIRGIELEAGAPLGLVAPALDAFAVGFSGYWAEGENRRTGASLDEVGPATGVLHLDWASASGQWDVRLSGLFARASRRDAAAPGALFSVPGHGVVDLLAAWRPTGRLTLRAGVFNLGDKTWWRWGDVLRLPADDPLVPHRSAPGRSLSVSFNLDLGPGRT
jgi:hemoglobin/transferrin/lactoferrin receptor protein